MIAPGRRYRQFTQFGVEEIGSKDPAVDAEIIAMAFQLFRELGLTDLVLHLQFRRLPEVPSRLPSKTARFLRRQEGSAL